MSDLVERLRARAKLYRTAWGDKNPDLVSEEAADRIEELEGALTEATEQLALLAKDPATNPLVQECIAALKGPSVSQEQG